MYGHIYSVLTSVTRELLTGLQNPSDGGGIVILTNNCYKYLNFFNHRLGIYYFDQKMLIYDHDNYYIIFIGGRNKYSVF